MSEQALQMPLFAGLPAYVPTGDPYEDWRWGEILADEADLLAEARAMGVEVRL